ncbi:class I lanthipeptide [Taibaiella chishuiensis]|uniref:Natural product n=1 Tax=Taibaiella chishuiensis TaxID=1434707 RepID=A0A2P8D640_9BACT|nr:class I lanthipeptide [Taibaiella chishuiensis]PSK92661.1 hypothetical protein B0I18_103238 [Taibaiella chishuiensis]
MKKKIVSLRKLSLHKEVLANLNSDEQYSVRGGGITDQPNCPTKAPSCIYPCTTTTSATPTCQTAQNCPSANNPTACLTTKPVCATVGC